MMDDDNDAGNDNTKPASETSEGGGLLDSVSLDAHLLQGFDPSKHVARDGVPVLTSTGEFRRKPGRKLGQKNGEKAAPASGAPTPKKRTPLEKKSEEMSAEGAAIVLCGFATQTMSKLIGPEWDFQSQQEADAVRGALAAYIRSKGDSFDLPPGVMLTLVLTTYAATRFQHENTRSKFGRFWDFAKSGFKRIFSR